MNPKLRSEKAPRDSSKIDLVAKTCLYRISTGAWVPGDRLPSTREGAQLWGVSPLTVLRAYQRLADMGLVRSSERSGCFVEPNEAITRLTMMGASWDQLLDRVTQIIREETTLEPAAVLQRLHHIAMDRARAAPTCAFLECTMYQSQMLASQVESRLGWPCLAFLTDHPEAAQQILPQHVNMLLTTGFHINEVSVLAKATGREAYAVPIELDPEFISQLSGISGEVLLMSLDADQAKLVAEDVQAATGGGRWTLKTGASKPETIADDVERWLGDPREPRSDRFTVLSSTLWSSLPEAWSSCPHVISHRCRICESAWPDLAGAIRMPLGSA